jgi:RNA polymerase sigma-70 factor (ECF subfamily)
MNLEHSLITLAASGDLNAFEQLVMLHGDRLKTMITARMDQRLARYMETSDVTQEVNIEILKRLPEYLGRSHLPYFVWVRLLAKQKLVELARRYIHTQARDVRREQPMHGVFPDSSNILTGYFYDRIESPSSIVRKLELRELLVQVIESLPETDREILLLRHVEQLTTPEAAAELQISENTCRQRHLRALKRLKELLEKNHISLSE